MKKILVIDDQKDNLISITALLKNFLPECKILTAQSGPEGIEMAHRGEPDTILLDIIMPKMDGYEVCKKLKKDELTKHIPVVLITEIKTDPESRIKGLEIGADAFLSKPIDPAELSAQIKVMLRIKYAEDKLYSEKVDLENLVVARTKDLYETNKKLRLEITERKQAEEEKLKLQMQLQQAQKMEAIGTLAGGIAHDFNNILSAIIGYTEIALDDVKKETLLHNNLQEVFKAGKRAKNLVKQILTFSRRSEQELQQLQVKYLAKDALKLLRASLPTTIEIRQDIQSDSFVLADPTQIHQVLMNLCTNAGFALQDKGGVLEVKLEDMELDTDFTSRHPDMKPGSYMKLTVSDTGHGMPPDVLERAFDPFFTTKKKGEGTGMGLSVVHGIVKNHGGTVTASSEPGKGSTFKVFLPVIEAKADSEKKKEGTIPKGKEHILFIDDEQGLVDLGKLMLESFGYKVTAKTSSVEALKLFKSQPDKFDLIITDMTMPSMTGEELAKEILAIRPDIRVILCTGFSQKIDKEKAESIGIRTLLLKPILRQQMAETVREVLDSHFEL